MLTTSDLLSMDRRKRKKRIAEGIVHGELSARRDLIMPRDGVILVSTLNDAAQRGDYDAIILELPPVENVAVVLGDPMIAAAFISLNRVEAVFRVKDNALLGYRLFWATTIQPRSGSQQDGDGTLGRYLRKPSGSLSPYEQLKRAAENIADTAGLAPLWTGAYAGAFAGFKLDGTTFSEVTWSATAGVQENRQIAEHMNVNAPLELWRRLKNWRWGRTVQDANMLRSRFRIDVPSELEAERAWAQDHWYLDGFDDAPKVMLGIAQTFVSPAAESLLRAHLRLPEIKGVLETEMHIVLDRIPKTIAPIQPLELAKARRGLVTVMQKPEDCGYTVKFIDDE